MKLITDSDISRWKNSGYLQDHPAFENFSGLSMRAANCLESMGINSKSEAKLEFKKYRSFGFCHVRNLGEKTFYEIRSWCGL